MIGITYKDSIIQIMSITRKTGCKQSGIQMVLLLERGAMKQGQGTCCTFKAFNLTYLHVLRAGIVYISLWSVHALELTRLGMCTYVSYGYGLNRPL